MTAENAIRNALPSLWRFEPGARGLLPDLVRATAKGLSVARIDGANTMQSHWSRFSDYAPIDPYVSAFRQDANLPVLLPADPEVEDHAYLDDLARLAGVLGLAPYADPKAAREAVEQFRRRVFGTVALWRNGVSTRAAIRQAANLALSGTDERALNVEEFSPVSTHTQNIATRGAPKTLVGPLMRWQVDSQSVADVVPEILIEGITPKAGKIDSTNQPAIERFDPATGTGTAILYEGAVAPGQTLSITPNFSSWLGANDGLRSATATPGEAPANQTAPGPWTDAVGAPTGRIVDIASGADGALWVAVDDAGDGQLWRLTSAGWSQTFSGLPVPHCLSPHGDDLLLGHENGVARLALFNAPLALLPDPASATDPAVQAVSTNKDGTVWLATASGAARLGPGDTLQQIGPGARVETETPLSAVLSEEDGVTIFGGALGLFRHDAASGNWYVFTGSSLDETVPDWQLWNSATDALPSEADIFLPGVTTLLRGPDTLLWIGTDNGIANWGAHRIRNTYNTRTRAFPALTDGAVNSLKLDVRGRIWAATDRGILVHDGVDWFEENGTLQRLERPDGETPQSGWRFDRTGGTWQFADATGTGFAPASLALITTDNAPVTAIHWTDGAQARLGSLSDGSFIADESATPANLRLRIKPTADRIIDGGLPAIPRLHAGKSDWRYLQLEEASVPTPSRFPAWTREGRLLTPPSESKAPFEGRYLNRKERALLDQVFSYNPAARVSFAWQPLAPFSITVRLDQPDPAETLPGAVLDRVFEAADRVRPAAANLHLAFGETFVRGE